MVRRGEVMCATTTARMTSSNGTWSFCTWASGTPSENINIFIYLYVYKYNYIYIFFIYSFQSAPLRTPDVDPDSPNGFILNLDPDIYQYPTPVLVSGHLLTLLFSCPMNMPHAFVNNYQLKI